ncbi:uncharacterized protein B0I36DRAFT_413931, partial [Microdochium trichocladiopsis]
GFISKTLFLEQLDTNRESLNVFLLVSMLAISARFTPALCRRFRDGKTASEFFTDIAQVLVAEEMWKTTLENTQAFFLLGLADWGQGARDRSAICMGIAVRMAGVLRLHREETFALPPDAPADQVVKSESGRRTFWIIQNHDNLYTQEHLPTSFSKEDITTLLPCDESDFAFGRIPPTRGALPGTPPSLSDPSLVWSPQRSLFATLIQVHDLWGMIARDVHPARTKDAEPIWIPESSYSRKAKALEEWESRMPPQHRWSVWNLRGFKAENLDLAYLSIVTITRLNNIILRRAYLDDLLNHTSQEQQPPLAICSPGSGAPPHGFWEAFSRDLFVNSWRLFEAIDFWYELRAADDGYPAMLALCIYACGSTAHCLIKWPQLFPDYASSAKNVAKKSMEMLLTFEKKWSTVSRWVDNLR